LTAQQRAEFGSLFDNLFERSYNSLVLRFLAVRQSTYDGESITPDRAVVQTTLVDRTTKGPLPIEYRLIRRDQRWAVFDVTFDGMSLVLNYPSAVRSDYAERFVRRVAAED
jgi:phospholipid transport system substrate-binding protein